MIHLDTSFLIRSLVPASDEDAILRGWLRTGELLGMSMLAWTEFLCGPLDENQVESASAIVPSRVTFDEDGSVLAARLFNDSGRRRGSLVDCMIASTAILADAELATSNTEDFQRFRGAGLQLVSIPDGEAS